MVEANIRIRESGVPNAEGLQLPTRSKFDINFMDAELEKCAYPDRQVTKFLKYGWPLRRKHVPANINSVVTNHKGATEYKKDIDNYLNLEISEGATIGPFSEIPFADSCISPLNSVPKSDDSRRVILDLSHPKNSERSVNAQVDNEFFQGEKILLTFPGVDDLVNIVKQKGRGCLLFKRDLKRAYRQIFIDPGDIHLLGYKWDNSFYFDCALPMGLNISAYICQRTTNALKAIAESHGCDCVFYLDDGAGAERPSDADIAFQILGLIIYLSGCEESVPKIFYPNTRMPFLGVLFDTLSCTLEITPERLAEIKTLIAKWENKRQATRNELESLIGKLSFVAACVRPGRVFLARIINALSGWPETPLEIPQEIRRDLWWWGEFISTYNGVSMMPWHEWCRPDAELTTDACLQGGGATFRGEHFACKFPDWILQSEPNINFLEFLVLIVAVKIWKSKLKGLRVVVHCDNLVTVFVVNTGRAKSRDLQRACRELAFQAATGEVEIRSQHISGAHNRVADWLSRYHCSAGAKKLFDDWNLFECSKEVIVSPELFRFNDKW